MSLQYSSTRINLSFSGTSGQSILDGIRNGLLAAGWNELQRFRAFAAFSNAPGGSNVGDGVWIQIGSTIYQFYTVTPPTNGSIPVQAGATPAISYSRLHTAINANDPLFTSPFGGDFAAPYNFSGVTILAKDFGTSSNNVALGVVASNVGGWVTDSQGTSPSSVTSGGGWELESQATQGGVAFRVLLVGDIHVGGTTPTFANVYVTSITEEVISAAFSLTIDPVLQYRIICDPYQFFVFAQESLTQATNVAAGVPFLQSFLVPLTISAATTTTPVVCTTSTAHGLTTGTTISIEEGREVCSVTSLGTQSSGPHNGEILVNAANDFLNGDVVQLATGDSAVDGVYVIANASSSSFSLNKSKGGPSDTGTAAGIAHWLNGSWQVTVIDSFNFSLNTSAGVGKQPYIASTALMAPPGQLCRAIWADYGNNNFSLRRASGSNTIFMALNSASYGSLTGSDTANLRLVIPGLAGRALTFSNGCSVITEPLLAAGPNGAGTAALVFGQLWDAAVICSAYILDLESNFDTHNYHQFNNVVGDSTDFQSSLWLAIS